MILYTYKNISNRISYYLDANTTIRPGEIKTSTVKVTNPNLQIIKTEELNDNVSAAAGIESIIQASGKDFVLTTSLATAKLTSLGFNKGTAFSLEDTGKIKVHKDGIVLAICNVLMGTISGMSGDAHSICRTTLKLNRNNKDTVMLDTRNFIKYYSNTGGTTTSGILQVKTNDVIFIQLTCNHARTATTDLSLVML